MYKKQLAQRSSLKVNDSYEGERIEEKINRIVNNKEPITDGAPMIYTERKDGVQPQYDIRTDRFELAVDAMDKVTKSHLAKRDLSLGERAYKNMTEEQKSEFHKKYPEHRNTKEYNAKKNPETGDSRNDNK